MSELELNKAIAKALYPDAEITHSNSKECSVFIKNPNDSDLPWVQVKDYCNNWNDLMPLVIEHMFNINIARNLVDVEEFAHGNSVSMDFYKLFQDDDCSVDHKCKITLRALAECLLKALTDQS